MGPLTLLIGLLGLLMMAALLFAAEAPLGRMPNRVTGERRQLPVMPGAGPILTRRLLARHPEPGRTR